jgi:hypothetical protein
VTALRFVQSENDWSPTIFRVGKHDSRVDGAGSAGMPP